MARRRDSNRDEDDDWELMGPWDSDPFDSLFPDINADFRRMRKFMEQVRRRAMKGELPSPDQGGPFVYGFSMRTGPDGVPHIQKFGNLPRGGPQFKPGAIPEGLPAFEANEREPLTDVMEGDNAITITVELPGVEKEDIDIDVTETAVSLQVPTQQRRYAKEIQLPAPVKPKSARATYRNGILDLVLEKQEPAAPSGHKVAVE